MNFLFFVFKIFSKNSFCKFKKYNLRKLDFEIRNFKEKGILNFELRILRKRKLRIRHFRKLENQLKKLEI